MNNEGSLGASDRRIGQQFGDYVVEGQIGRGGMGVVFRARHVGSGEAVALKLMAPDLADNTTFRERFVREAEAGPNLGHPNIVPVFESGEADGELFIAMQLIEGTDLKGLIEQEGRLDPKRVLSIFRQAASALDAAHESGMVHRDVKPQNILVIPRNGPEETDRVYLTDFGLVRPVASEASASRTGTVFGSVAYMAPELIEGIPADGRADVYALGCVLYECLTGVVPFERDNEVSAVWAHIHEDPPLLTDKCPDLPGGLNDVVLKAMSKHPDDRYLTSGEFITELELGLGRKLSNLKYAYVRPLVARIPHRKTEREVWAPNYFPELSRVRSATRQSLDLRKVIAFGIGIFLLLSVQLGREGGLPEAVADVADAAGSVGNQVLDSAFGGDGEATDRYQIEPVAGSGPIVGGGADTDALALLPAAPGPGANGAGNREEGVPPDENAPPAGPLIAYVSEADGDSDIWVMKPDGTGKRKLTENTLGDSDPAWSPDGTKIAFVTHTASVPSATVVGQRARGIRISDIYVMDADGGGLTRLTSDADLESDPTWSPDGRRIAFSEVGDDEKPRIMVMNVDGSQEQAIADGADPAWSPDGRWIALVDIQTGKIFTTRPDGSVWRSAFTSSSGELESPVWSPDGTRIAFMHIPSDSTAFPKLTVMPFTGQLALVGPRDGEIGEMTSGPDWSPDGRYLIYTVFSDIYKITPDGKNRSLIVDNPGGDKVRDPVWRP